MTKTASEIVNDAAALVLVDAEATSLTGDDFAIVARALNDMNAENEFLGVDYGARPITNPADPTGINPAAVSGVKYALAERIAPLFGVPYVASSAAVSSVRALDNFLRPIVSSYPDTLPQGSGNLYYAYQTTEFNFYRDYQPDGSALIKTAQTVDIVTVAVPVLIIGPWTVDRKENISLSTAGLFEYSGGDYLAHLTLVSTAADSYEISFFQNGVIVPESTVGVDNADSGARIDLEWYGTIREGDSIAIAAANTSDVTDLTVNVAQFRVT